MSRQVEGRLVALGVLLSPARSHRDGLSPCPEGAQETTGHPESAPPPPWLGTYAALVLVQARSPNPSMVLLAWASLRAHRLQFL